jgi:predicted Zn-dependent protease
MRLLRVIMLLLLTVAMRGYAADLPDLGDVSQATLSPQEEREIGRQVMHDIRSDPQYYDDAEATDYLNSLGYRLVSNSPVDSQNFHFFLMRADDINAFALPGAYIGVNTGTILAAQSESELASVIAHEIGHISQHHMSRRLAHQKQTMIMSLAALALGILAARSNSDLSEAAIAGSQAGAIQSELGFSRSNEREADQVGLQILEKAGFDPRAMVSFFKRLERSNRFSEAGAAPAYLQTHPLTYQRIAYLEDRVQNLPYKQVPDSLAFDLIRARLRALLDSSQQALKFFQDSVSQKRYSNEAAARYGLVIALMRNRDYKQAETEFATLHKLAPSSPIVETLGAELKMNAGDTAGAVQAYRTALASFPSYRALIDGYADALLRTHQPHTALNFITGKLQDASDDKLYHLQAQAYFALHKPFQAHRAMAEAYAQIGSLPAAIEQLQIALKTPGADFYEKSSAEARMRELKRLDKEQRKEAASSKF